MNSMVKSLHNADSLPSGCLSNSHDRGKSAFIQCLARVMVMNQKIIIIDSFPLLYLATFIKTSPLWTGFRVLKVFNRQPSISRHKNRGTP